MHLTKDDALAARDTKQYPNQLALSCKTAEFYCATKYLNRMYFRVPVSLFLRSVNLSDFFCEP